MSGEFGVFGERRARLWEVVWCSVFRCGMVLYGVVWWGVVWYGVVWCGMVWLTVVPVYAVLPPGKSIRYVIDCAAGGGAVSGVSRASFYFR